MGGINARQTRGRATQQMVARWFREHGWLYAQAVTGAVGGRDITNMPALAPEVKATSDNPGPASLRQAKRNASAGDLPFTVWRPNGYGQAQVEDFVVMVTLADFTQLLHDAGYGDKTPGGAS